MRSRVRGFALAVAIVAGCKGSGGGGGGGSGSGGSGGPAGSAVSSDARARVADAAPAAVADAALAVPDAAPPGRGEVLVGGAGGPPFYLDEREVTVADYKACVDAGGCTPTSRFVDGTDPTAALGGATFAQARGYCAWRGKRLPTPTEWKRATFRDVKRHYPWGDDAPTCERAVLAGCATAPTPPGRDAGASAWGALDLIGNVEEWCDEGVDLTRACVATQPRDATVIGGSYATPPAELDRTFVKTVDRTADDWTLGLRCARSAGGASPAPDPIVRALTGGGGWLAIEPTPGATEAIAAAAERCPDTPATPVAGTLLGLRGKGWIVVRGAFATEAEARAAGPDAVAAPAAPLVRVSGTARCNGVFDPGPPKLAARVGGRTWRFAVPDTGYQLWVRRGDPIELTLTCPPTTCGSDPECSPGRAGAIDPVAVPIPPGALGVEVTPLEISSGCTCD